MSWVGVCCVFSACFHVQGGTCVLYCLEMENWKLIVLNVEYTLNMGFNCGELCCAEDGN